MEYNIVLERYQGPMDLLLDLIRKNEIDIYDIPIFEITEQFLDYMEKANKINLELTSDFILMASTLLEIKSKMLLPKIKFDDDEQEEDEEDARKELVEKLLEYEKYQQLSGLLKKNEEYETRAFYRKKSEMPDFSDKDLLKDLKVNDLSKAFMNILIRNKNKVVKSIYRENFSVETAINVLKSRLLINNKFYFTKLLEDYPSREELISLFLGLLELIRNGILSAKQTENFTDIFIELRNLDE